MKIKVSESIRADIGAVQCFLREDRGKVESFECDDGSISLHSVEAMVVAAEEIVGEQTMDQPGTATDAAKRAMEWGRDILLDTSQYNPKPGAFAARAVEANQASFNDVRAAVRKALESAFGEWPYIEDIFADFAVFSVYTEEGRRLMKVGYSFDNETDSASLDGEAVAVSARVVYDPIVLKASEALHLEQYVGAQEQAKSARIKLIDAGWGSTGYYSQELLERDGPTAFPAGTQMFMNHVSEKERKEKPERDIKNLAAVLKTPAQFEHDPEGGPGLYASAVVFSDFATAVREKASYTGVSIDADAMYVMGEAEGRHGKILTQLLASPFNTVDFVTKAGRGGKVISVSESLRQETNEVTQEKDSMKTQQELAMEAQEAKMTSLQESIKEFRAREQALQQKVTALQESLTQKEATSAALKVLEDKESKLGPKTRTAVAEAIGKQPPMKDGALDLETLSGLVLAKEREFIGYFQETMGPLVQNPGTGDDSTMSQAEFEGKLKSGFSSLFGLSAKASEAAAKGRG